MRILPVIDLMQGQVVRGIAGNRAAYRPIESRLASGSSPVAIARGLITAFAADEIYVADLDAIAGAEPDWKSYSELLGCGLSLWIDAGISDVDRARKLCEFGSGASQRFAAVIAGLESLVDENSLSKLLDAVGPQRLVFSLDLRAGQPLARFAAWQKLAPLEIARAAILAGVRRMIVLDLAGVGVGGGVPTLELCRAIRTVAPQVEITTGGGVRGIDDLSAMADAGCEAALVASALHDGRLTPAEVATLSE
jgi:phosphoribosylformimino-5-aminoimidazole carboxamide ribotide isomerase